MKHGAYAKFCLEGEDLSRFKMLFLDLLSEYKPQGFEEKLLVDEIAQTIWRKNRFKAAEAFALHSYSFIKSQGGMQKGDVGLAIAQDAAAYGTIPRCLAAEDLLDRRLWGLFDRLRKRQKKRGFCPRKSTGGSPGAVIGRTQSDESPVSPVSSATSALGPPVIGNNSIQAKKPSATRSAVSRDS